MTVQPEPQAVLAPLTMSAIFLTVSIADHADSAAVREVVASVADLTKDVAIRDETNSVTCIVGIGSQAWDRLGITPRPRQLRPFQEITGQVHTAVATPGDLFFHIRANRQDLCFELEWLILSELGDLVQVVDEVSGFRYFDARDLLGFVDGTANPVGTQMTNAALVGDDDPRFTGGSYVVVQKYTHQITDWGNLPTDEQEAIIGRTKFANRELDDATGADQKSHKTLNTITDADGNEHDILRDNMPFGSPADGVFGTYFIGYAGDLSVTEEMLRRMFIGDPVGKHDRILDFSTPQTGCTFFVPTADFVEELAD